MPSRGPTLPWMIPNFPWWANRKRKTQRADALLTSPEADAACKRCLARIAQIDPLEVGRWVEEEKIGSSCKEPLFQPRACPAPLTLPYPHGQNQGAQ